MMAETVLKARNEPRESCVSWMAQLGRKMGVKVTVPLTTEQMTAATAAQRLLGDEGCGGPEPNCGGRGAEGVFLGEAAAREANRQLVLAVSRIRGELQADAELPGSQKAADAEAKAFE